MIRTRNLDPQSAIRGRGLNPFLMVLPGTNFTGICASAGAVVGTKLALTGSMVTTNSGTATSGSLDIPTSISIITDAIADAATVDVVGLNHLGQPASETITKLTGSIQTRPGAIVWSYIKSITPTLLSGAINLRVGVFYDTYTPTGGDLNTQSIVGVTPTGALNSSARAIPLPAPIKLITDVVAIRPLGGGQVTATNAATMVTTYTATTVVGSVTAWDLSLVQVGDIAVTRDGSVGSITVVNDGADTLTVNAWIRAQAAVTPLSGGVLNPVTVYRPNGFRTQIDATGGWASSQRLIYNSGGGSFPIFNGGNGVVYVRPQFTVEPIAPILYEVSLENGYV